MPELIRFHSDLYRRDALTAAADSYRDRLQVDFAEAGSDVVASLEALVAGALPQPVVDEFCNEAFAATVRRLREGGGQPGRSQERNEAATSTPPWGLLAPFAEGATIGLGWSIESLSPIRSGAAQLVFRNEQGSTARVAIRRNQGAPLGVARTDHLDFMLMNGGGGASHSEESISRVLSFIADTLRQQAAPDAALLDALSPHAEAQAAVGGRGAAPAAGRTKASTRIAPHIDPQHGTISFEVNEGGLSRLEIFDAVLGFADRCYVYLTRPDAKRIGVRLRPRGELSTEALRLLVRDVTATLNRITRKALGSDAEGHASVGGSAPVARANVDIEALLVELEAADPMTLGLGFVADRGPGHENLRVLNIRGTGACNSECLFCIEKFNPYHRAMPKTDATRQFILDAAGRFDMLFFASGEPTIHPRLFEHVELAKSVGFTSFGMSSHFRTFADPRFALKTLQAGFAYFDIALHAADPVSQLAINPIGDDGRSLWEALKGLAVLYRLAEALGVRISVTHKIVVSRLNVTDLDAVFHATYDRGVRHFILQPVRTLDLEPDHEKALAIPEEQILPYVNDLLRSTENLGVVMKPYGFSRQGLLSGGHVEYEQNRVKNVYGKARGPGKLKAIPQAKEERPNDGRFWVEVEMPTSDRRRERFGFSSDGKGPVLDDALGRGMDLDYGCRMGACGMCCVRLVEGSVDQSTQIFLTEEQIQKGYVLMCQARPLSNLLLRTCTSDEIDEL